MRAWLIFAFYFSVVPVTKFVNGDKLTTQIAYPIIDIALEKIGVMGVKNLNDLPSMGWIQTNAWEIATNSCYIIILIIVAVMNSIRRNAQAGPVNYPLENIVIE